MEGSDKELWLNICKNEYCYCAVIEAYDTVKYFLNKIVKDDSEEHSIVVNLFREIDESLQMGNFTIKYRMSELPEIHSKLILLVNGLLTKQPNKGQEIVVDSLQHIYDIVVRDFPKERRTIAQLRQDGLVTIRTGNKILFEDTLKLPNIEDHLFYRKLR